MAQYTNRYGFSYFGGGTPGSIMDDGSKFTREDPKTLDALLYALASHNHDGGDKLGDPVAAPTLELNLTDGLIAANKTYYYQIAFVDAYGLETRPSDEVSVTTPAPLVEPAAPVVFTDVGGLLTVNTIYYYAISILAGDEETGLSPSTLVSIGETDRTAVITLPPMTPGGEEYRIWRRAAGESSFTQLATTASETYTDDGAIPSDPCACEPDNLPPDGNNTNSTNAVLIQLSSQDAALVESADSPVAAWRIYRSEVSGTYPGSSLIAEVVETQATGDDGIGPLVVEYLDIGTTPLPGQPRRISQTFQPPPALEGGGSGSGAGALQIKGENRGWALSADYDGALTTQPSDILPAVENYLVLTDADGVTWRVTVEADGTLSTTDTFTPARKDILYALDEGPLVGTPDATFAYQLFVDTDGILLTTPVGQRNNEQAIPKSIVGSGAPTGVAGWNSGDTYYDRTDAFAIWVFDEVWHKVGEEPTTDDVTIESVESDANADTVTVTWSEA